MSHKTWHFTWRATSASCLLFAGMLMLPPTFANISDAQVNALVQNWGNALKQGNTSRMEAMAGGKLVTKRRGLWRSAEFAEELRETYAGANITLTEVQRDSNATALIEICIQFAGGLPMYRTLTVSDVSGKGDYRVIDDAPTTR